MERGVVLEVPNGYNKTVLLLRAWKDARGIEHDVKNVSVTGGTIMMAGDETGHHWIGIELRSESRRTTKKDRGAEVTFNRFSDMRIEGAGAGIVLSGEGELASIIGNEFTSMELEHVRTGVEFLIRDNPNAHIDWNHFVDIHVICDPRAGHQTIFGVKNVCGRGNIFSNVVLHDLHHLIDGGEQALISENARRTMIIGGTIPDGCTDNGIDTEIIY
jgi:hypothetical protein